MDAPAIIRLLYNKDICKCSSCGGKIIPLPTEQHFYKTKTTYALLTYHNCIFFLASLGRLISGVIIQD
mgnify:CR=1 FL=1